LLNLGTLRIKISLHAMHNFLIEYTFLKLVWLEEFYIITDLCQAKVRIYLVITLHYITHEFYTKWKSEDTVWDAVRSIGNGHEREYCRPTHRYYHHRRNYRDRDGGCYKSQRRGSRRTPRHRGGLADLAKGETPRRDTRRAAPRNLDILRSNSQNRYHPCLRARSLSTSFFLKSFSSRK